MSIKNYEQAPYLLLATAKGMIKKSALSEYDSSRSGGIIGINLKPNDRVISAQLVTKKNDVANATQNFHVKRIPGMESWSVSVIT